MKSTEYRQVLIIVFSVNVFYYNYTMHGAIRGRAHTLICDTSGVLCFNKFISQHTIT